MESELLRLNGILWSVFRMAERSWLLRPQVAENALTHIQNAVLRLEEVEIPLLEDTVAAYDSLLLTFGSKDINLQKILQSIKESNDNTRRNFKSHEIKVCYDLGLDWNEVENKTNLSKEEIISIHTSTQYSIAMFGFLLGFMFLEGLDQRIWVPRKDNPRTKVDSGSVGIGGEQTGIYSLESPGGWQIIGRTPDQFFDINNKTPTNFTAGDIITFRKISSKEFESLEKKNG